MGEPMDAGMTVTVYLTPTRKESEGGEEHFQRAITLDPLRSTVIVGRASKTLSKGLFPARDNGWFDSPIMSREHAELSMTMDGDVSYHPTVPISPTKTYKDIGVILQDLDSTHGTWLGKRRLVGRESDKRARLHSGDVITFGSTVTSGPDTFPACPFEVEISVPSSDEPAVADSSSSPVSERSGFHVPDTEIGSYASDASDAESCHIVNSHPRTFSVPSSCDEMDASDDDDVVISASRRSRLRLTTLPADRPPEDQEIFQVDDVDGQPNGQGHGPENDSQLGSAVDPIDVDEASSDLAFSSDEEDEPETDDEIPDIDDEDKQVNSKNGKVTPTVEILQTSKGAAMPNTVSSQSKREMALEAMIQPESFASAQEGSCGHGLPCQANLEPAQQQSHENEEALIDTNLDLIPDTYEDERVASDQHVASYMSRWSGHVTKAGNATEDDFSTRGARAPSSDYDDEDTPDDIPEIQFQSRTPAMPMPDSFARESKQNRPLECTAPTQGSAKGSFNSFLAGRGAQSSTPHMSDRAGKEGLQLRPWQGLSDEWQEPSVKEVDPIPRWRLGTCISRSQFDEPPPGNARAPSPSDAALARKADIRISDLIEFGDTPPFNTVNNDDLYSFPGPHRRIHNTPSFPAEANPSPSFQIYQDPIRNKNSRPARKENAMIAAPKPYVQGPFSTSYQSSIPDELRSLYPSPPQKKKCLVKLKYDKAGEVVQEKVDDSKARKVDISNLVNPQSEASRGTKRKIDDSDVDHSAFEYQAFQAAPSSLQISPELSRGKSPIPGGVAAPQTETTSETNITPKAQEPPRKKAKTTPSSTAGTIGKVVSGVCLGVVGAFAALVAATPSDVWEEALRETARSI
ncbi:MAG: hypothetical protein Q9174_004853 [Haloplaca sp. 1 TL-2023]